MSSTINSSSFENLLQKAVSDATKPFSNDPYTVGAFEAYLFGYSFAWLYGRYEQAANASAGPRGISVPANSFYVHTTPEAASQDSIAPNVNVLYASAFLNVTPGNPVVVQTPNVSANKQFTDLQITNGATQNYQQPYPSSDLNIATSIQNTTNPTGGLVLLYWANDDVNQYKGNFTQKIAINTNMNLLTGRTITDPSLDSSSPNVSEASNYSVNTIQPLASQYIATTYKEFANNPFGNYTMNKIANATSTTVDQSIKEKYDYYSKALNDTHFWEVLAQSFNYSAPPSFGKGSDANYGKAPIDYSKELGKYGIVYDQSTGYKFDPNAVSDKQKWLVATEAAYKLVSDFNQIESNNSSTGWQNVPSSLGSYSNNLFGYLTRDLAHAASSPDSGLYPLTYSDSSGQSLMGGKTYVMILRNALSTGAPPLAPQNVSSFLNSTNSIKNPDTIINQGGFWSFTAYDQNLSVTPAVSGYSSAVNPNLPASTFNDPNTGNPVYTLSSLQLPPAPNSNGLVQPQTSSIPKGDQFRVEDNGDIYLILSPYRPIDPAYHNNWLPTPLVTYLPEAKSGEPNFTSPTKDGVNYSIILRTYNPNIASSGFDAVMHIPGTESKYMPDGYRWNFPAIIQLDGAAAEKNLAEYLKSQNVEKKYIVNSDTIELTGGLGINTAIYKYDSSLFSIVNDGISINVKGYIDGKQIENNLANFQQIQFKNGTLVFDLISPKDMSIYSLYEGAFNRPADTAGFRYWSDLLDTNKLSIKNVAQTFLDSNEGIRLGLNTASNSDFVNILYHNFFDRAPDQDGFNFWSKQLNDGLSRSDMMASFAQSPEAIDLVGIQSKSGFFTT